MAGLGQVRLDRMGDVAILVLVHPPANLWTRAMSQELGLRLQEALADPTVKTIVLRGEGRGFSAGAPLAQALDAALQQDLAALCDRIEAAPKPVIAAVHGMALGAGLALALAAHARIAHAAAVLGLPEVSLGLVPAGGASQRLARAVGIEAALRLVLQARPIPAAEALALGLVDEVAPGILGQAALAMAARGPSLRRLSQELPRDLSQLPRRIAEARAGLARGAGAAAAGRAIDCIEAAGILPFDMGLALEQAAFADLAATATAAALVHALSVERRALQPPAELGPGPGGAEPWPELHRVGLRGAGPFAGEFGLQAVKAGLEVVLVDPDRAALTGALATVVGGLDAEVAAGRMTEADREAAWGRISALQGTDLPEGEGQPLDLVLEPPGAETGMAAVLGAGVLGPGLTVAEGVGGLSELSVGRRVDRVTLVRLAALGRRLGWRVVTVGPGGPVELGLRLAVEAAVAALSPGQDPEALRAALAAAGIGGGAEGAAAPAALGQEAAVHPVVRAVLAALAAEGVRMLEDGRARSAADIDAVALLSGLVPRVLGGPMHQADRRGLLVLRAELRRLGPDPVFAVPELLDRLVAAGGRLGDPGAA